MNLGLLYSERVGRLRAAGKPREARDAAAKVARYMPSANAWFNLGVTDYGLGDKAAALADFRKAIELDPAIKQRLQGPAPEGGRGQALRAVLEDKEFLKQVQ
jgi:tetratricopeptide (TPR) repeat protein